jgi:RNA polymerase sigma factor (sigma-70 family)
MALSLPAPPVASPLRDARPITRLVRAAASGDARAWEALVRSAGPVVRRAAAGFKLSPADIEDVAQITWLRAYDRLGTLREPEAFVGWVVVTARREALRLLQRQAPEILTDDFSHLDEQGGQWAEDTVIDAERADAVRSAVERLPEHQRRLLRWIIAHPGACYAEIAADLAMPIGSIGPTRERALARLRQDQQLIAVAA